MRAKPTQAEIDAQFIKVRDAVWEFAGFLVAECHDKEACDQVLIGLGEIRKAKMKAGGSESEPA